MTHLVEALQALDLDAQIELDGRWVVLDGERCKAYVIEGRRGREYFTWCDHEQVRTVESYSDPISAIRRALQRAAKQPSS